MNLEQMRIELRDMLVECIAEDHMAMERVTKSLGFKGPSMENGALSGTTGNRVLMYMGVSAANTSDDLVSVLTALSLALSTYDLTPEDKAAMLTAMDAARRIANRTSDAKEVVHSRGVRLIGREEKYLLMSLMGE